MTDAIKQIESLRLAAKQIKECHFAGWGNTCIDAANHIAAQDAEIARLREAGGDFLKAVKTVECYIYGEAPDHQADEYSEAESRFFSALTTPKG